MKKSFCLPMMSYLTKGGQKYHVCWEVASNAFKIIKKRKKMFISLTFFCQKVRKAKTDIFLRTHTKKDYF